MSAVSRIAVLGLLACNGPEDTDLIEDPNPICDGVQQPLEDDVDAPFDRDGDGFFDAANPDCASAWRPNQLDCDDDDPAVNPTALELTCDGVDNDCRSATPDDPDVDTDGVGACTDCDDRAPLVFPGAAEVCFDQVDNDCDGTTDNHCGEDYNGTFQLHADGVDVRCQPIPILPPFVDIDFDRVQVTWNPPHLTLSPLDATMPAPMDGTVDTEAGTFLVEATVGGLQAGVCQERYAIEGTFDSADSFHAVFSYTFEAGSPGSCGGCNLSGTRVISATRL